MKIEMEFKSPDEAIIFLNGGQEAVTSWKSGQRSGPTVAGAAAQGAEKQLTKAPSEPDSEADKTPPPPPKVKEMLQEAGVPPSEWPGIPRTGKGNRITQGDAKAYIAVRSKPSPAEEPYPADPNGPATPGGPHRPRDFPEPASPPAPAAQPSSPPAADAPVTSAGETPSFDEVKAALQALSEAKGIPTCIAALSRFGQQKISEMPEKDFAAFIEYANKAAAGEIDPSAAEE